MNYGFIFYTPLCLLGFPCGSAGKKICLQCGRPGFNPWAGKIPWRRERLSTLVFWPGEFHGLYSPWGHEESDMTTEQLSLSLQLFVDVTFFSKRLENTSKPETLSSVLFSPPIMCDSATPWTAARQASLSITNSQSLLKLMSIELVMPISSSDIPFSCFKSFPASGTFPVSQFFASRGQSYWSFSFSISPSGEYSGLISFRMDWLDLLAVQGTLKSLLQHHSSKASILRCSAFFIVQLPHPYMTTGKTIAFTRWIFVG